MPGSVNRFPQGLLGLLEAKQNGATPDQSEDRLQFGLDLLPFYLSGGGLKLAKENENGVPPLLQTYATVEIPVSEVWAVMGVACSVIIIGPGELCTATAIIGNIPTFTESGLADPSEFVLNNVPGFQATTLVGGARRTYSSWFSTPLIVRSPTNFSTRVTDVASASASFETQVLYYRLE